VSREERCGILAAGNFIVDRIKRIDAFPEESMLANIEDEMRSNGGGPYNVLKDLAAMGAEYPLMAAGCIGTDADGDWIRGDCQAHGVDTSRLVSEADYPTSYTEVMTARKSGRRTFFHHRGANANFDGRQLDFTDCPTRLFHLAYLMLLDALDEFSDDGRSGAAHLLEKASSAGMITSIDIVSAENQRFRDIVLSATPYTDHLLINEVEASRVLGFSVDPADPRGLLAAAEALLATGVRQAVVIHTEHGSVTSRRDGHAYTQGAVRLPEDSIIGANGAGDAFAAGYLHGVHEDFPPKFALELAVSTAASCLADTSPSAAMLPLDECLALGRTQGFQEFEVS